MEFVEVSRLRLVIDSKEAVNGLAALDNEISALREKQKEFGKGSAEYKAIAQEIKVLEKAYADVNSRMDLNQMNLKQLLKYQKELYVSGKELVEGTDEFVAHQAKLTEVNDRVKHLNGLLKQTSTEVDSSKGVWSSFKGWVMGAFAVTAIIEFGKKVIEAGKAVFELTAKFEKYETVLKNTLGGQDEAVAAMDMIKEIAATTPISVDEMTNSFIKMVNRGIQPTKTEIKQLADLAASQGKSFDQLTEAVLDAMMGEGERLKEFGVKMRKNGDDISLMFKGQTVEVKNNEKAIFDAIVAMGAYNGVAGMTSEISKTLEGRVSNLGDAWDFVVLKIGEKLKPVFIEILSLFAKGVDWISELIDVSNPFISVIVDIAKTTWGLVESLTTWFLRLLPAGVTNSVTLSNVMKLLASVLNVVSVGMRLTLGAVQLLIDGFVVLGDAAKVVYKILSGDFQGAIKAAENLNDSWGTLKTNAEKNFTGIANSFKKIWVEQEAGAKKSMETVDMYGKLVTDTEKTVTKESEAENNKRTKAVEKAAKEQLKAQEDALLAILDASVMTFEKMGTEEEKAYLNRNRIWKDSEKAFEMSEENKKAHFQKMMNEIVAEAGDSKDKQAAIEKQLSDKIIEFHNKTHSNFEEIIKKEAKMSEDVLNTFTQVLNTVFDHFTSKIDAQIAATDDKRRKLLYEAQKDEAELTKKATGTVVSFISGDIKGAVTGLVDTIFQAVNNEALKKDRAIKLQVELDTERIAAQIDFINGKIDKVVGLTNDIQSIYSAFLDSTDKMLTNEYDSGTSILDLFAKIGDENKKILDTTHAQRATSYSMVAALIDAEVRRGQAIQDYYQIAVEKENERHDIAIDGIDKVSEKEKNAAQSVYDDAISKINEQYDLEIRRINEKYDLISAKSNEQFNAETLAIIENQSEQLLSLITNEESKTSVVSEFAEKRSQIEQQFALAYQDIREGMSQEEIDAIYAARDARDKALTDLQNWYNTELEYVVNSEGQKRKEYSETDKIKQDAEFQLDLLRDGYAIKDIERERDKNIELRNEAEKKDAATLAAAQTLSAELQRIETQRIADLLAENIKYNDTLVQLATDRDVAMAASFENLKALMLQQIAEIQTALNNLGPGNMEQFQELSGLLSQIIGQYKELTGLEVPNNTGTRGSDNNTNTNTNTNTNNPRKFAGGTEFVDEQANYGYGVDKVPAFLNRGERVLSTEDNAVLGKMTNEELMRRVMSTFRQNTAGFADKLMNSSISVSGKFPEFLGSRTTTPQVAPMMNNITATVDTSEVVGLLMQIHERLGDLQVIDETIKNKPVVSTKILSDYSAALAENTRRGSFG